MTFAGFVEVHAQGLSPRLREVFVLLALSCDDDTIGLCLRLRYGTVRHYIDRVLDRIGVRTREDVALLALLSIVDGTTTLVDVRVIFGVERSARLIKLLTSRTRVAALGRGSASANQPDSQG